MTREVVGDTTTVRNHAPVWSDTAMLTAELTIGLEDGPEEYQFASIISFTVDRLGAVYVYDDNYRELRKYAPNGEFLATFGRHGGGPGEFEFVTGIAVVPDGRVLALDQVNNRINVYSPEGAPLDHWPRPQTRPTRGALALRADSAGYIYVGVNPLLPVNGSPLPWPRPTFIRMDGRGNIVDTLFVPSRFLEACPVRSEQKYRSGFLDDIRAPYVPKVRWAVTSAGALVAGCPTDYSVDVLGPDGILRIIRDPWTPITVSDAELDNFRRLWTLQKRETRMDPDFTWTAPLPNRKPAYQRILVGQEGRLWLWTPQGSIEVELSDRLPSHWPDTRWRDRPGGLFDVFEPGGRYLGAVRVPTNVGYTPHPGSGDPIFWGDTVWAITTNADDVESLTRFRVSWGGS